MAGALARVRRRSPATRSGSCRSNNAVAFACVFGIARRGAVWCPINPRNEAAENRALLELFDCECLIYHSALRADGRAIAGSATTGLPGRPGALAGRSRRSAAGRARRRPRDARRHRRHDRAAQGRDAHRAQPRDDDRADADGLPVRGPPGVPRARAADPRGRRAVLPGDGARRADRRHAEARPRRVPRADRARAHHAHVPAADADLHAARPRGVRRHGPLARCSASGTARRRCRRPGWRRR